MARLIPALLITLVVVMAGPGMLEAHGEDAAPVVTSEAVGAWVLDAWISPSEPRPGEIHLSTRVSSDGRPVTDCRIRVRATPLDRAGQTIVAEAGPALVANGFRHEARLHLEQDGRYRIAITVTDPDGSSHVHSFEIHARPVSFPMRLLVLAQSALVPIIALWLTREAWIVYHRYRRSQPLHS